MIRFGTRGRGRSLGLQLSPAIRDPVLEQSYADVVVVAEQTWKLGGDARGSTPNVDFTGHLGGFDWKLERLSDGVSLKCEGIGKSTVLVEFQAIFFANLWLDRTAFVVDKQLERITLREMQQSWTLHKPPSTNGSTQYDRVVVVVRILKRREEFPDFSDANLSIGHLRCDRKLQVGDRLFHVSAKLLSSLSPYFDQLFHGDFAESRADTIPLTGEKADPLVFHDFLLCMLPTDQVENRKEVLPNTKNVAELLRLADFYQVELVKNKCKLHLAFCEDMDIGQRVILVSKYWRWLEEPRERLLKAMTPEESKKLNSMLLEGPL